MGGVLYRAIADKNPPDAVTRIRGDTLGADLAGLRGKYSDSFLRAIEWALTPDEKMRPQSVEQWKTALLAEKAVAVPARPVPREIPRKLPPREEPEPRSWRWPIVIGLAVVAAIAFGAWKKHAARVEAEQAAAAVVKPDAGSTEAPQAPAVTASPTPVLPETRDATPPEVKPAEEPAAEPQRRVSRNEAEFNAADANGDGYLSADEARRFPALSRNFQRVDTDGDGRISLREFQEARRAMLERRFAK
jgi:hypothetical protein